MATSPVSSCETTTLPDHPEKMALLGRMVCNLAHELHNPLTSIVGYSQLLLGRGLNEIQSAEARKIFDQANRAREIVRNLLLFSGSERAEPVEINVNEIIQQSLWLRKRQLSMEGVIVATDFAASPLVIMGNPVTLRQTLLNLLVNAEHSIVESGVSGRGRIQIRTRQLPGNRLRLDVEDNGKGIPDEDIVRIFEPFFTTRPAGTGTGLGLSIAREIITRHGGEIFAEKPLHAGARVVVLLPLAGNQRREIHAAVPPHLSFSVPSGNRILIMEDDSTVADLVRDILSEDGNTVLIASDAAKAASLLREQTFDLVICDLHMDRAGLSLQACTLFITGDLPSSPNMRFLEASGFPWLAKPFLIEELRSAVERCLSRANAAAVGASTSEMPRNARP